MNELLKQQSERFAHLLTERLIEKVKEKGFKTTYIAEEIGIGQASMSRYINGVREMPMSVFLAICEFASLDADDLISQVSTEITSGTTTNTTTDNEEKLAQRILAKHKQDKFSTAAFEDTNKEVESEYIADEGA